MVNANFMVYNRTKQVKKQILAMPDAMQYIANYIEMYSTLKCGISDVSILQVVAKRMHLRCSTNKNNVN